MARGHGHVAEPLHRLRTACPVENVTLLDVQQFLAKLNARRPPPPTLRYRLPTEAEWEYACRARHHRTVLDRREPDHGAGELQRQVPVRIVPAGEFRQKPTPAGTFALNPWGLADMHGNVWEWTSDWYGPYSEAAAANIDPHGPAIGEKTRDPRRQLVLRREQRALRRCATRTRRRTRASAWGSGWRPIER